MDPSLVNMLYTAAAVLVLMFSVVYPVYRLRQENIKLKKQREEVERKMDELFKRLEEINNLTKEQNHV